jgi:hypothetical protein
MHHDYNVEDIIILKKPGILITLESPRTDLHLIFAVYSNGTTHHIENDNVSQRVGIIKVMQYLEKLWPFGNQKMHYTKCRDNLIS